jgi:hypothetical protein
MGHTVNENVTIQSGCSLVKICRTSMHRFNAASFFSSNVRSVLPLTGVAKYTFLFIIPFS